MIFILSGDDTVSSRNRLTELTDGFKTTTLDGKTLNLKLLEENLVSQSLFDEKKAVIIENISKNPKKKELITFLNFEDLKVLLILWEDKKAHKTTFSSLKNAKSEEFMLPTYYFKFLDSLTPQNRKEIFTLYHKLLKSYAPEQVFYSLLKRARHLVVLSSGAKNDEILKMSSWQLGNLNRQLQNWQKDSLYDFYESLKQTEIKLKTGGLPLSLSKHLDILLLSKL